MNKGQINIGLLYRALDAHRAARDLMWHNVAAETGLSPSTLSRMARGQRPNIDGFAACCRWMGMPMDTFARQRSPGDTPELETEVAVLLHRHQVPTEDAEFVLSAVRAVDQRRTTRPAA